MNNLSNTAKKLDRVFEIAYIVIGALAIACIVGVALIAAGYILKWDPSTIGSGYESLEVSFLKLEIAENYAPDRWLVLLNTAVTLLIACRLFYDCRRGIGCIREILLPMKDEKPFDSIISTNVKKLARLSISFGILLNILKLFEQIMVVFVYKLPDLMVSETITQVSGMFNLDLTFLLYWGILHLLSYVFRYGEELQQLSDETL